jgi:Tol biopolymer transport system component
LIYWTPGLGGQRQGDLAVYAFADGSTERLTETPEAESSPRWTPDGERLVFVRGDNFQRIVQVDMSDAIGGGE